MTRSPRSGAASSGPAGTGRRQHLVAMRPEPLAKRLVEDLAGGGELQVIAAVDLLAVDQALDRLGIVGVVLQLVGGLRLLLQCQSRPLMRIQASKSSATGMGGKAMISSNSSCL